MRFRGRALSEFSGAGGEWQCTTFFTLVEVAHDWGLRPSELGLCDPVEDLDLMTAYTRTTAKMHAVEARAREKAARRAMRRRV